MAKAKKKDEKREYIVECSIKGTCAVFVEASSEEEAKRLAAEGEGQSELNEWWIGDVETAILNE